MFVHNSDLLWEPLFRPRRCPKVLGYSSGELSGLSDERLVWVADRQVEARLLIDLIKVPEFRVAKLDWVAA